MARQRKEKKAQAVRAEDITLQQPDRSGPKDKTLLDLAQDKNLFEQADDRMRELKKAKKNDDDTISPGAERVIEAGLWTASLMMLHLTFDILVQKQYGEEIDWNTVFKRTGQAFLGFYFLFYFLHEHEANPDLVPRVPRKHQKTIRQVVFFAISVFAGCGLIYVTNMKGYIANMKRAPPLACLWLWAVVELELKWAVSSLVIALAFFLQGGYKFL